MMCHTIKVIDDNRYNTFRINSSVCKPFNADFDGDKILSSIGSCLISYVYTNWDKQYKYTFKYLLGIKINI